MRNIVPKTIKSQLISVVLFIVFSVFIFAFTFQRSFQELEVLDSASVEILKSQTSLLMLRRHEKDFMARDDLKYQKRFKEEYEALTVKLKDAQVKLQSLDVENQATISDMLKKLDKYHDDFNALVERRMEIGASHDDGLKGAARAASHQVENELLKVKNSELYNMLLMLRRHEKDFLLRKEQEYVNKFNDLFLTMESTLKTSRIPESNRLIAETALRNYHNEFNVLADTKNQVGLTPQNGLHGSLRASVHEAEEQMSTLSETLLTTIEKREETVTTKLTLIGLGLAILACLGLGLITRHVTGKITIANALMKKIAEGESSLQVRMNLKGDDELSQMAESFNRFIANLQRTMEKIATISADLTNNARRSLVMASETASNAEKQRAESDSVSTAMTEMTATSKEIAQSVATAAMVAKELQASAQTGREVNKETSSKASQLSESMRSASENMEKLNANSEEIGSVIDVIRAITEQTNLLALNAAIEAARAGEQGRGFAVVADQVRELAMKTHHSTDEITKIIQQLQDGIKHSVSQMNESSKMAELSVKQAHEGASVMASMVTQIEDIAGQNLQIATASEEQTMVTESVDRNIIAIVDLSSNTSEAARKSNNAASAIEQLAEQLENLVGTFTGNTPLAQGKATNKAAHTTFNQVPHQAHTVNG